NNVLVAELRRMSEVLYVIVILARTLNIHVTRIPVALLRRPLRTPMRPNAEFSIAKPVGTPILFQRFPIAFENRFRLIVETSRRGRGYRFQRGSSCDLHTSAPVSAARLPRAP